MRDRLIKKNDHWATPDYIYNPLNEEFQFDFDPCPLNHDISIWDGLLVEWGRSNFVNPPYSAFLKKAFILKAIEEKQKGKRSVFIVPVSTSTVLFHDFIRPNIIEPPRFIRGRVKFIGYNTKGKRISKTNAMHDSMILVF